MGQLVGAQFYVPSQDLSKGGFLLDYNMNC